MKRQLITGLLLLVMLVALFAVTSAQDEPVEACDYTSLADSIIEQVTGLAESESPDETLTALQSMITSFRIACTGFSFNSEDDGLQPVLGPITFEDGLYRATATTEGYIIVQVESLSGECDTGFGSLFNESAGDASDGAQNIITTESCEALLLIDNVTEPWTLEFEKLR